MHRVAARPGKRGGASGRIRASGEARFQSCADDGRRRAASAGGHSEIFRPPGGNGRGPRGGTADDDNGNDALDATRGESSDERVSVSLRGKGVAGFAVRFSFGEFGPGAGGGRGGASF